MENEYTEHGRRKVPRRDFLKLGGVGLVGLGLAGCGAAAQSAGTVTLRYAHTNSPDENVGLFADELAELVGKRTNGRVKIEVYPASQLGGLQEMILGAQDGSIDMGHNNFSAVAQLYRDLAIFDVPYLYRDIDHAMMATNPRTSTVLRELNAAAVSETGVRIVGNVFHGFRHLTCNRTVHEPSDLQGQKVRAIPLPVWITMVEGMGTTPTAVDFSELPTSLQTGVVDGQENPLDTIYTNAFYTSQSHLMLTEHMISSMAVYFNEDSWQKLASRDQRIMQETLDELSQTTAERGLEEDRALVPKLQEEGMTVVDEEKGLDLEAFRESVSAHARETFPEWREDLNRIEDIGSRDGG